MPLPPSSYTSGPVSPQQLNTDLYGSPSLGPSGVLFHANRPLLVQTVVQGGTAYSPLSQQPVGVPGLLAYSVIDTTALTGPGADNPGIHGHFSFQNFVPASGGSAGLYTGQWLTWGFPFLNRVTVPPGGVGAGMTQDGVFNNTGTFQYGGTVHNNCPYHLDLIAPGAGSANTSQPSFWWLTPSVPVLSVNATDSAGQTPRMGFLWQCVTSRGGTVSSIPSVAQSWGTVTSAALNGMGSALTFLNNPPSLRVATSTQTLPTATSTAISFGSAPSIDNYSGWSTSASAYTVPLPGLYLWSPTLAWAAASSTGQRRCGITVTAGGSTVSYQGPSYQSTPVGPGTTGTGLTASAVARVFSLKAGDTVSGYGWQNSGANLALYSGLSSRLIGAYLTPQAAAGTTLAYTPPVTGFRFQAGALSGTAITAALNARIGGDVSFLLNRPYFTGYQSAAQGSFANNSGFHQVNVDTLGALPWGGNGDNYGGWSASNHWYAAQVAGQYLVIFDGYATTPSATTAVLTAGIFCSTSGGITPSASPDQYQQVPFPSTTAVSPGAFAMGVYYLQPGEHVYPMLQAQDWGGTWGTFVSTAATGMIASQFSCFWISE